MTGIRLYTLVTGHIEATGVRFVTASGGELRRDVHWPVACWLVLHPDGVLLWDTGMPDAWAAEAGGVRLSGMHWVVTGTLTSRLAGAGLDPAGVTHLALSHLHLDHAGNVEMFPHATLLAHEREWLAFVADPPVEDLQPHLAPLRDVPVHLLSGDHDVFGDGTVTMLETPGHTPGHMALLVKLPETGPVLLAGDLWYAATDRRDRIAPSWNDDLAATWRSMDRIERVLAETGARVVIGHDAGSIASLPLPPGYLD